MEQTPAGFKTDFLRIILLFASIIILSWLTSSTLGLSPDSSKMYFAVVVTVFLAGIIITSVLLVFPNLSVGKTFGFAVILKAAINGFAFLFPFAIMAVLSDYVFKWNAIQPIASAAIFTCVSVSASDLMKLGGKRAGNLVCSFLSSVIFLGLFLGCGMLVNTLQQLLSTIKL
jgi:hypothetical protein